MASSTKKNASNTLINTEVNTETVKVIKKTVKKAESTPAVVAAEVPKPVRKTVKKVESTPAVVAAEVPKPVNIPIITETAVIVSPPVLEPSPVISASKVTLNTIHTWPFPLGSRP
jgi:hypothetical protein